MSSMVQWSSLHTPAPTIPLHPAPVQCPPHCPALPGVMCYAHNNNVMCHNPDIDVKFCKNIWRSGYGPCQGLSRVNLQCAILLKHHRCHRCQNCQTLRMLCVTSSCHASLLAEIKAVSRGINDVCHIVIARRPASSTTTAV